MTETAPATPAPNVVARAATAVTTGAVNGWTFLVGLLPSINAAVTSLAIPLLCVALGIGGAVGYQKAMAPLSVPVALPDLPKPAPVPVVSVEIVDHALGLHCGTLGGKLDVLLQRTEPKAAPIAPKKTAARSGK